MPWTTAIIILFMLNKRVSWQVMCLIAAFIFSVNPFYVTILVTFSGLLLSSKSAPKLLLPQKKSCADKSSYTPEELSSDIEKSVGLEYDHILIGNDLSTLYCAALLSRNNHKCCVLQPLDGVPTKVLTSVSIRLP